MGAINTKVLGVVVTADFKWAKKCKVEPTELGKNYRLKLTVSCR